MESEWEVRHVTKWQASPTRQLTTTQCLESRSVQAEESHKQDSSVGFKSFDPKPIPVHIHIQTYRRAKNSHSFRPFSLKLQTMLVCIFVSNFCEGENWEFWERSYDITYHSEIRTRTAPACRQSRCQSCWSWKKFKICFKMNQKQKERQLGLNKQQHNYATLLAIGQSSTQLALMTILILILEYHTITISIISASS